MEEEEEEKRKEERRKGKREDLRYGTMIWYRKVWNLSMDTCLGLYGNYGSMEV